MRIGKKLSIMSTVLLLICISVTVGVSYNIAKENINELTEASIQENIKIYKDIINLELKTHIVRGELLAKDRTIIESVSKIELAQDELENSKKEQAAISERLKVEVAENNELENIAIINRQGEIIISANETAIGMDVSEREYFKKTISQKESYVGDSLTSKDSGQQIVPVCTPIIDQSGNIIGVVSSIMLTDLVAEELEGARILGTENTYPILFDQNGVMLVHRDKEFIGQKHEDPNIIEAISRMGKDNNIISGELTYTSIVSNDERIMRYIEVEEANWLLGITLDHKEMMQPLKKIQTGGSIILIIALIIGAIATYFCVRSILKPLNRIQEIIVKLAHLDLRDSKDLEKLRKLKDEVGNMAEATATTTESLKEVMDELMYYADQTMVSANKVDTLAAESLEQSEQTVVIVEQLSASMEEINASTEEVSSTVDSINENIKVITEHIAKSGELALDIAKNSELLKEKTILEEAEVKEKYETVKNNMQGALEKAGVISQINLLVDSIKAITAQTNLLALNASIEAARAGEAGRGFGVVAHEIGTLARESASAVSKIQEVISLVLEATHEMKESAQSSLQFMENQMISSRETTSKNTAFYIKNANEVYDALQELEERSHELTQYSEVITQTVTGIAIVIAENTEGVVYIASQTTNINDNISKIKEQSIDNKAMATKLTQLAARFKL